MSGRPIQIWEPTGDRWVRPPQRRLGDHYASEQVLHPKRPDGPQRVILVGESVAAGYLYAPDFTPAHVLAHMLPTAEVIDLACVNESLSSLVGTVEDAIQLEPDVVVMWGGNNWMLHDLAAISPYHPRSNSRRSLAAALDERGLAGAGEVGESALRHVALPLLDRLLAAVRRVDARLIVIVPEANRCDWEHRQPVTWLPGGGVDDWYRAYGQRDGGAMLALDEGSCATSHRIAAADAPPHDQPELHAREVTAAAGALRGTSASPMATPSVQRLLHRWSARHSLDTIDVGDLIDAAGDMPDRTWFLDYCHHTSAAICSIMNEVANILATTARPRTSLVPTGPVEAGAAIGAMVHTAHRLVSVHDPMPLLRYWRQQAVTAWDGTPERLTDLIESRLGPAPTVLNPATAPLTCGPGRLGFAHGLRPEGADVAVLLAAGASREQLSRLQLAPERAFPVSTMWEPAEHLWTDVRPAPGQAAPALHRSVWPSSSFLVTTTGAHAGIAVTARTAKPGVATIALDRWRAPIRLGPNWSTHRLRPTAGSVKPGLHRLRIHWPPVKSQTNGWQQAITALAEARVACLHPIFGEVFSLQIAAQSP